MKKDLLDLLLGMYDEETDSRMDDEELRAQVCLGLLFWCHLGCPAGSHRGLRLRAKKMQDSKTKTSWHMAPSRHPRAPFSQNQLLPGLPGL